MKNLLIAALTFIQLTGSNGMPVWIVTSQIIAVTGIEGRCENTTMFSYIANAYVETQIHGFCVRETVNQIVDKLTKDDER